VKDRKPTKPRSFVEHIEDYLTAHVEPGGTMTLEGACKEAERRTKELKTDHYVYQTIACGPDEYIITSRTLKGYSPVHTYFVDGSELES
jgi:hypothetical protein